MKPGAGTADGVHSASMAAGLTGRVGIGRRSAISRTRFSGDGSTGLGYGDSNPAAVSSGSSDDENDGRTADGTVAMGSGGATARVGRMHTGRGTRGLVSASPTGPAGAYFGRHSDGALMAHAAGRVLPPGTRG